MTAPQDPFGTPPPGATPPPPPPAYGQPPSGQAPYGQAPYGQVPFGQVPFTPGARNGFGVAALVLGVLALPGIFTILFGLLFGLLAVVFGVLGRNRAKRGEASNGGVALAGIVLGALAMLVSIALIAFGVSILNSDSGREYQDCLREAGSDRAAVERCAEEFADSVTS